MKKFIVSPGTEVIVLREDAEWAGLNFRLLTTRKMNTFTQDQVIVDPETGECTHYAPNAQKFGPAYARNGYYGFRQNGHCMLVMVEKVFVGEIEVIAEQDAA